MQKNKILRHSEHQLELTVYRLREENGRLKDHVKSLQRELLEAVRSTRNSSSVIGDANSDLHRLANGVAEHAAEDNHSNLMDTSQTQSAVENAQLISIIARIENELFQTKEDVAGTATFSFIWHLLSRHTYVVE